jgi:hypothetical protein
MMKIEYLFKEYFVEQVIWYNLVWVSLHLTQTRLCKYNLFNNFKYSL